jgi:hypothetical protein
VKVANGERLQSYGSCKSTDVLVQGEQFNVDCYTLPLKGFDVILGIQWLKSLDPIVWEFAALSMAFIPEGCTVVSSDVVGLRVRFTPCNQPTTLWIHFCTPIKISLRNLRGLPPQQSHDHPFTYCLGLHL